MALPEAQMLLPAVRPDGPAVPAVLGAAALHRLQPLPARQEQIGLALYVSGVGVPKEHPGVLHHLGADAAPPGLARLVVGVVPGVEAGVPVHRRVAHELPGQPPQLVLLVEGLQLGVHRPAGIFQADPRRHGGGVDFQVVGGGGRHQEEHDPPDKVEYRRGQSVGLDPLPLLADEKILVAAHRLVQVDGVVEGHPLLVFRPDALGRDVLLHQSSASLLPTW